MALQDLEKKLTPIARTGQPIYKQVPRKVIYDGTLFPYFLYRNGIEPTKVREFLRRSRIGSPFDLEVGEEVRVELL